MGQKRRILSPPLRSFLSKRARREGEGLGEGSICFAHLQLSVRLVQVDQRLVLHEFHGHLDRHEVARQVGSLLELRQPLQAPVHRRVHNFLVPGVGCAHKTPRLNAWRVSRVPSLRVGFVGGHGDIAIYRDMGSDR